LSHLFTWANRLGLTSNHPVRGVGSLKANRRERYLSREEIDRLLFACDGALKAMVILALGTGMRASEVLSLDRDHVNLKDKVAILAETKNGERRIVPLPLPVVDMLLARPLPIRELFPGWNLRRLGSEFGKAVETAGLSEVTFHTLRHTFASHAVMSGV